MTSIYQGKKIARVQDVKSYWDLFELLRHNPSRRMFYVACYQWKLITENELVRLQKGCSSSLVSSATRERIMQIWQ